MRNWHVTIINIECIINTSCRCTLPMRNWHIKFITSSKSFLCCTLPMRNWHFSCPAKFVFVFISCTLPMRNWHVTDIQLFLIHDYIYNLCCTLPMRNWHFNNAVVSFHIFCCTLPMRNWHVSVPRFFTQFCFWTLYLAYEELTHSW